MQAVNTENFRGLIDDHFEWLAMFGAERPFPLRRDEIEVGGSGSRVLFGFVGDRGYRSFRVRSLANDTDGLTLELSGAFGRPEETMRLTPRISAAELRSETELAKLRRAEEIARAFQNDGYGKPRNISLSGRLARITLSANRGGGPVVLADLSDTMTHEALLASAFAALTGPAERREGPVCIAAAKTKARELQKLAAVLKPSAASALRIFELIKSRDGVIDGIRELRSLRTVELWRGKTKRITGRCVPAPSGSAKMLLALAPDDIDVIHSKHGETLRFNGLPFARVREVAGASAAWFGVGKQRTPLNDETRPLFNDLINDLKNYRSAFSGSNRHELFRRSSEAWLEFKLRQNIRSLDPNLVLSPVYHQFTAENDRIDLLALRSDGRLVIIEVKTSPDRETVFQAADYWRKVEHQRRKGILSEADLFGGKKIADKPALVYVAAPAFSFHNSFEDFARLIMPEMELWRWELHRDWRHRVNVLARRNYSEMF